MSTPLEFLENDEQFMIVNGPAGTGKTSLISQLITESRKLGLSYDAVAYTGKAASNLRSKTKGTGKTIHSFLYSYDYVQKEDENDWRRQRLIKFDDLDILFVDEASMISSSVEGFTVNKTKTYLLLELLSAVKVKKIKKIMLVGDSHQLPPIVEEHKIYDNETTNDGIILDNSESLFPDSMNEEILRAKFGLSGNAFNLSQNWRYDDGLNSYKLSIDLRKDITIRDSVKSSPKKWIVKKTGRNKLIENEDEVIDWVVERGSDSSFNNVRILTFTNEKASEWNRKIRKKLGRIDASTGEVAEISPNEPMMNLINKEFSQFYNGDSFIIKELISNPLPLKGDSDCDVHGSCKRRPDRPSSLYVQKAKVEIYNENKSFDKDVNLITRGVSPNDSKLIEAYNHRLWCDFATRNESLYKHRTESMVAHEAWDNARKNDEVYATGIASYAYASTVHKTQGDSFEYVVIDLEDEQKNLKWLYTALTRSNKDFILYGKKSIKDWF
jgi:molybdopterin-guanine dinucleotide biosynthesis protein